MKKDNGITLIALIITIIIMLILVAVSVSILINSGLIGKAREAGKDTKSAYEEEGKLGESINVDGEMFNSIDEIVALESTEDLDKDIRLQVTNNNDRITITATGKENITNVTFFNEDSEIVMNRTNPEESKTYSFTTQMTYAGNYTVKAYDVLERESEEKSITVATDRELTYLYNQGTISDLAQDFQFAKDNSQYAGGTFQKNADHLYLAKENGVSNVWADSGFSTSAAVDISDYSTLTFKFTPTSYMKSSQASQYKSYSYLFLGVVDEAPSTTMTKRPVGRIIGTESNYQSTLYFTEDSYDVPIGTDEGDYYIGIITNPGYWYEQKWVLYCTEIYLH